jgi:hypothetical protein
MAGRRLDLCSRFVPNVCGSRLLIFDDGFFFDVLLTLAAYQSPWPLPASREFPHRHERVGKWRAPRDGHNAYPKHAIWISTWPRRLPCGGGSRSLAKSLRVGSERLDTVEWFPTEIPQARLEKEGPVGREAEVSVEQFRRRADECRRLAAAARNASDRAFWLGLVERWQTLESQKARQAVRPKSRSPLRRQSELPADG